MIRNILYFSILAILAAAAIFFVLHNDTGINVFFTEQYQLTNYNSGVVFLGFFVLGFIVAWIFAGYLIFKGLILRKKLEFDKNKKEKFIYSMLEARDAFASGNYLKAKTLWQTVKKRDPSKILANIEIAKVLEAEGKPLEALKAIDEARAVSPENTEVLFKAYELNEKLGNKTAALDNLALILSRRPNKHAALRARNLSEEIGRFQDALEYNNKALELGSVTDHMGAEARLTLRSLLQSSDNQSPEGLLTLKKELTKLGKKYKNSPEILQKMAEFEQSEGNIDNAAELLFKASSIKNDAALWNAAVQLWIDNNLPDRALATAKAATKNTKGLDRIKAEIDVIKVNLTLSKIEEAKRLIDALPELISNEKVKVPDTIKKDYLFLKGFCLNRLGDHKAAAKLWVQLSNSDLQIERCQEKLNTSNE